MVVTVIWNKTNNTTLESNSENVLLISSQLVFKFKTVYCLYGQWMQSACPDRKYTSVQIYCYIFLPLLYGPLPAVHFIHTR